MKTWKIHFQAQIGSHTYTPDISVTQRFKPTMVCARQLARNAVDGFLDSRRALTSLQVLNIVHVAR